MRLSFSEGINNSIVTTRSTGFCQAGRQTISAMKRDDMFILSSFALLAITKGKQ